jgi:hypothetical protein
VDDRLGAVDCPQSSLDAGAWMECQVNGIAEPGQYRNRGTVTGTPPIGSDVLAYDDSHYFGMEPEIALAKRTNGLDADEAPGPYVVVGQPVEWTYVVTNSGNVTLTQVIVTDDQEVDVSCPMEVLGAGESMTCTAEGSAVLGQYSNLGLVSGQPPEGDGVSAIDSSHYFGINPRIELQKQTNGVDADVSPGPEVLEGLSVEWTYVVSNTGDVDLTDVTVVDDQGIEPDCPQAVLAPGEKMICTANGISVAGQYANIGTATGTHPGDGIVEATDPSHYLGIALRPVVDVQKRTNGFNADLPPGPYISVGDPVEWEYLVTNSGNVTVIELTVVDDQGVTVACPGDSLAALESMVCTGSGIAVAGQYTNVVTATGAVLRTGEIISDTDPSHYFGSVPGIMLAKRTDGLDADEAPGPYVVVGEPVEWTYVVTNSGNVTLTQVIVTDDQEVDVSCPMELLGAGESMTCTAEGSAVLGQYSNLGLVNGQPPEGDAVSATDASHYFGINPRIELEKHTNGVDADESPGPEVLASSPITWTYVVSNTGDVELTDVIVSDDQGVEPVCPHTSLASGEKMTCTASSISVAGQYANIGTATATHPGGGSVQASDPSHYLGIALRPVVDVQKSTNGFNADLPPGPYIPVGDPVEWEYLVTNSGNVTLVELTVVDDQGVIIVCPEDRLAALDSMVCTGSGIAEAGQYANVVTATGAVLWTGEIISDTDPSHYFGSVSGIALEKLTNGLDADDAPGPHLSAGETVTWSYRVANTGNVPLTAVAVTDDQGVRVSCPSTTLGASATMTCTATGQVQVGQYVNIGSVVGTFGSEVVTDSDPSHYYGLYTIYLPLVAR